MKKVLAAIGFMLLYILGFLGIAYILHQNGGLPAGDDTMYHIYRAELLIENFKEGVYFPLFDPHMYNGVQIFRYFAPASAYGIALFQMLGQQFFPAEVYIGYELYTGFLFFVGALGWLIAGLKEDRPFLGGFLGLLWFFTPNSLYNYFAAGNMAMGFCLALVPYLYEAVFLFMTKKDVRQIKWIVLSTVLIILGHLGFGGMVALALLLYLLIFKLANFRVRGILPVIFLVITGALLIGIWTLPGAVGGMASMGGSALSISNFQSILTSLNPMARLAYDGKMHYFGLSVFLLSLFGILFSHRREKSGFIAGIIILFGTTLTMHPVIAALPGGRFLWMLRFITLAVALVYFALLYWKTLRPWILALFCALLVLDIVPSIQLFYRGPATETPAEELTAFAEETLLDEAKEITTQRIAVLDQATLAATAPYYLSTGEKRVLQSYGAGYEAAYTKKNIIMLNEALDQGAYAYLFDGCLAMGNDTVLLYVPVLKNGAADHDAAIEAAAAVGYELIDDNGSFLLFHYDTYETFGLISAYEAIGIGTSSSYMELYYPNMVEGDSDYIDEYTAEELKQYHTVMLDHFLYHDLDTAEAIVKEISDAGVRVVISADGIPTNQELQEREFLGVFATDVSFENGYPILYLNGETYDMDLFAELYQTWKTTFINGLDNTEGFFYDTGLEAPFLGTVYNDNIYVVGLNLFFHFTSTHDLSAKDMITYVMDMEMYELPQRTLVPLTVSYGKNEITITSENDGVNSTIAYQDNFVTNDNVFGQNQLLCVNSGTTTIRIVYPYLRQGLILCAVGLVLWILLYVFLRRRYGDGVPDEEYSDDAEA